MTQFSAYIGTEIHSDFRRQYVQILAQSMNCSRADM